MLDRILGHTVHPFLHLLGLIVLSFGLPMNKVLMSIGTIWLASNLVLKADFKQYWFRLKKSRMALFIGTLLLLHLTGLFYTEDFSYAFRDLNTKLPLFVIPIALIAYPIKKEWQNFPLYFFILSLLITSILNSYTSSVEPQTDFRSFSLFGSHIRYTILVVMGIAVIIHLTRFKWRWLLFSSPLILWFLYYTYQSQVFSGYVSLLMVVLSLFIYGSLRLQNTRIRLLSLFIVTGGIVGVVSLMTNYFSPDNTTFVFGNLPEYSKKGNPYYHDTTFMWFENGNHVMSFIVEEELKKSWNERSHIQLDALDKNGHEIKSTLVRYMSSKGLTKDAEGMKNMSDQDIQNVTLGYTNINQLNPSPFTRIENLKNEIQQYALTKDPNGNSLLERIEHFKTGIEIVKDHWFLGVGTGDVQLTFDTYYSQTHSKLEKDRWHRAHNQLLTFWITFGIPGLLLFAGLWYWMMLKAVKLKSFFILTFVLVAVGSFLSEDTIETQQGVTFISYFLGISGLIFSKDDEGCT